MNEVRERLEAQLMCMEQQDLADEGLGCYPYDCDECGLYCNKGTWEEQKEALSFAMDAITEIQKYRELGTVEELREAVEKQHI